jgi:hypothetical protein
MGISIDELRPETRKRKTRRHLKSETSEYLCFRSFLCPIHRPLNSFHRFILRQIDPRSSWMFARGTIRQSQISFPSSRRLPNPGKL